MGVGKMKRLILSSALLTALCVPALAMGWTGWGGNQGGNSQGGGGSYRGVPGPIAGAGLPIVAVGYGVYWLIRRRRRTPEK
jgi:hypothetical protein